MLTRPAPWFVLGSLLLSSGCEGSISEPAPALRENQPPPPSIRPGPAPVRRMTRFEYDNTVRDLLGDTTSPARDFGAEEEANGFSNNAANLVTTSALAEKYMRAAEGIAERATVDLATLMVCPMGADEDACSRAFIAEFLRRAFRRPATADEEAGFYALYQEGRAIDQRNGIAMVIEAALQSPAFLYRLELQPMVPGEPVVPLDGYKMASRLSYLLWGSMPDERLLQAAQEGRLETPDQIEREARRLIADPKSRAVVNEFHRQWLDYDRIANVGKDALLFPEWSPAIGALMADETRRFVEGTIFDGEGTLGALLTAPSLDLDPALIAFYGPGTRRGLLAQGSILTVNAHSNQTSPVHRGKLVREQFLCDIMPPPPPDVVITVPEPDPTSTARERFAQHSADSACAGCHRLMDPIGFGFEQYDGVGRFRTDEGGVAIDPSGTLTASDIDGEFSGVDDLSDRLASSMEMARCYTLQWFRFAYGRGETPDDEASLDAINEAFESSGGDVIELLVALTQTEAFRFRRVEGSR
jgi:hypothetical protein